MKTDKILSLLGLAQKAGKLVSGEFMTENAIKDGSARIVIVAEDASDNTKKKFSNSAAYYEIPIAIYGDKESVGHAIGKEFRASLAVTDDGFANAISRELRNRKEEA